MHDRLRWRECAEAAGRRRPVGPDPRAPAAGLPQHLPGRTDSRHTAAPRALLTACLGLLVAAASQAPRMPSAGLERRDLGSGHCVLEGTAWDSEAVAGLAERLEASGAYRAVYVGPLEPVFWGGLRFRLELHQAPDRPC